MVDLWCLCFLCGFFFVVVLFLFYLEVFSVKLKIFVVGFVVGFVFNLFSGVVVVVCVNNFVVQLNVMFFVVLIGKFVYYSYVKYGDGMSQLFFYDFLVCMLM